MMKKATVPSAKDKAIIARVTKDMAEPRLAESVRNENLAREFPLAAHIAKPTLSQAKRH
jgi:hypothetical protein